MSTPGHRWYVITFYSWQVVMLSKWHIQLPSCEMLHMSGKLVMKEGTEVHPEIGLSCQRLS